VVLLERSLRCNAEPEQSTAASPGTQPQDERRSLGCVWAALMETARTSVLAAFFGHAAGPFAVVGQKVLDATSRAHPSRALGHALRSHSVSPYMYTTNFSQITKKQLAMNLPLPWDCSISIFQFFSPCPMLLGAGGGSTSTPNALSKRGFGGRGSWWLEGQPHSPVPGAPWLRLAGAETRSLR